MITLHNIHKAFGEQVVLQGLNLSIPAGAITAVIGPSGEGKSVLIKHMIGLLSPDSGTVTIEGSDLATMSRSELNRFRERFAMVFQNAALLDSFTIYQNVALPLYERGQLSEQEIEEKVDFCLDKVGLGHTKNMVPSELSGGMVKRAALARALAMEPKLLFLDEPTSGLDPIGARNFDALIVELRDLLGITVVMITHDLESIFSIVDRLAVLADKKVVAEGSLENVLQSQHPFVEEFFKNEYTKERFKDKVKDV